MIWILTFYFTGALLMAMWVGYVMRKRLDEFDWHYHSSNIWFTFCLTILFWPVVLIFKPKAFLDSGKLFNFDLEIGGTVFKGIAERARLLHQLAKSPPPCAGTIYYSHKYVYDETDAGTGMRFLSDDIVAHFKKKELPFKNDGESVAMVAWIKNRDDSLTQPTEVPDQIDFEDMAFGMLEAGYGAVTCAECEASYSAGELSRDVPPTHNGWNIEVYSCPKGHKLLKHDYMHIYMR